MVNTYYRPEIIPEDDDLISKEVLDQMMDISIFSWLEEDLSKEEFDKLHPTQLVFGMIENEHTEDTKEKHPRPFVCLYKTDDNCMIGFQITSTTSSPLCKSPLIDWRDYSLRKPSYVNIHHTVKVYRSEIKFTSAKNLSRRDAIGLVNYMRNLDQHNKKTGYKAAYDIETEANNLEKILK